MPNNSPMGNNFDNKMNQGYANNNPASNNGGNSNDFMNFLNGYDNNVGNNMPNNSSMENNFDNGMNQGYANNNPASNNSGNNNDFANFLDGYDNNVGNENKYLNNSYNDNLMINDVNPPVSSNFNKPNDYVENSSNFVDVSKEESIDSVDTIISELKYVVDDIKAKSKFKVDTDEINFDDMYQITIKIDKRESL